MRQVFTSLILLCSISGVLGQDQTVTADAKPQNSIYVNLLGDASLISVNYDRQIEVSPTLLVSGKLGLGFNQEFQICLFGNCNFSAPKKYLTIPHHITANFGKDRHLFEIGIGGTVLFGNTSQPYFLYPIIGYRNIRMGSNKLHFRVFSQIPFSGIETDDILFFPVGISLGGSF